MDFPKTAIILAGGFGTRLSHVISDVPKPMAPIKGKPFLDIQLNYLKRQGIQQVCLATGFKHEIIEAYFTKNPVDGLDIIYSQEKTALGTGGAILQAMNYLNLNKSMTFVLNGDSFFDADLKALYNFHQQKSAEISICLKEMFQFERYGTVSVSNNGQVLSFNEKKAMKKGLINTGCYLIEPAKFIEISSAFGTSTFSFESEILEKFEQHQIKLFGHQQDGYFIDIGIPEDYFKACQDLG